MAGRPRHPDKGLEKVVRNAEERDWQATHNPKTGYYRLKCPCGNHMKWVAKTPSNPNYERNLRSWLERCDCWGE